MSVGNFAMALIFFPVLLIGLIESYKAAVRWLSAHCFCDPCGRPLARLIALAVPVMFIWAMAPGFPDYLNSLRTWVSFVGYLCCLVNGGYQIWYHRRWLRRWLKSGMKKSPRR